MLDDLGGYCKNAIERYDVPAISVAFHQNGSLNRGAGGILNYSTQSPATTESLFQIGSISKVFTTALVMMLWDRNSIELDAPVKRYLRDFQIADSQASETITVAQLLNHTSGIAGDYFPDDTQEDGPHIARYVDRCSQLPLVHEVGKHFSYSNAAFAIAGRLVEVVLGMSWHEAVSEYIFRPLKMRHSVSRPADLLPFSAAIGHLKDCDNRWKLCSGSYLCYGLAPAGLTMTMTASDLVRFGCAFFRNTQPAMGNSNAAEWLSWAALELMQSRTVDVPLSSYPLRKAMGLGWYICQHEPSGERYLEHNGLTNAQCALLRVFPERNICLVVQMNSATDDALLTVGRDLTQKLTGLDMSPTEKSIEERLSQKRQFYYEGTYRSYAGSFCFFVAGEQLQGSYHSDVTETDDLHFRLRSIGEEIFELIGDDGRLIMKVQFLEFDHNGKAQILFAGRRVCRRVDIESEKSQ